VQSRYTVRVTATSKGTGSRPQRQTLASQIDRLETILAGLPESLGQTVAEAVQDAVGKAVELAAKEALTNPELLQALQAQTAVTAQPAETGSLAKTLTQTWQRTSATVREKASSAGTALRQNAGWTWTKLGSMAAAVGSWLGGMCSWLGGGLQMTWTAMGAGRSNLASGCVAVFQMLPALLMVLWTYRKPVLVALTVGTVVVPEDQALLSDLGIDTSYSHCRLKPQPRECVCVATWTGRWPCTGSAWRPDRGQVNRS
jgi:hypothetical protein